MANGGIQMSDYFDDGKNNDKNNNLNIRNDENKRNYESNSNDNFYNGRYDKNVNTNGNHNYHKFHRRNENEHNKKTYQNRFGDYVNYNNNNNNIDNNSNINDDSNDNNNDNNNNNDNDNHYGYHNDNYDKHKNYNNYNSYNNYKNYNSKHYRRSQPQNPHNKPNTIRRPKQIQNQQINNDENKEYDKNYHFDSNLSHRSKEMMESILNGTYDCLICHKIVSRNEKIWSCKHCYVIFHLTCINQWAYIREKKEAEEEHREPKSQHLIKQVRCPACNYIDNKFLFDKYFCYCGKQSLEDYYDKNINNAFPHSCGEICQRTRGLTNECKHSCMAPCHPGPCESCHLPSNKANKCECGKMQYFLRCGEQEKEKRVCLMTCGKRLNCGIHNCELQCHHGSCQPCPIKNLMTCFCGKEKKEIACGNGKEIMLENNTKEMRFKCDKICDKLLTCGNHRCTSQCHIGSCSECPRKIVFPTMCACGKTRISIKNDNSTLRKSCLDPLPTCSEKCDRMLSCGIHFCKQICHDSKCNPCSVPVKKLCRCQSETKTLKCSEYHLKIQSILQNIENKTDEDIELITNPDSFVRCKRTCKKILNCGYHTCKTICCQGRNIVGYQGHICHEKCNRLLPCGQHYCSANCHAGSCLPCMVTYRNGYSCSCGNVTIPQAFQCGTIVIPNCTQKCFKELPCGHECMRTCHFGKCDEKCNTLTSKPCLTHKNVIHNIPCHIQYPSCGQPCERLLPCGQHYCQRLCHNDDCVASDTKEFNDMRKYGCKNFCNKVLSCNHLCLLSCHPNEEQCDAKECKAKIAVKCICGNRSEQQYCHGRTEYEIKAIPCDERCVIEERNKRFRDAFDISNDQKQNNNDNMNKRIPYATNTLQRCLKYMKMEHKKNEKNDNNDQHVIQPAFIMYYESLFMTYIQDTSNDCNEFKKKYPKIEVTPATTINDNQNKNVNNVYPSIYISRFNNGEERFIIYNMAMHYNIVAEKDDITNLKAIGIRLRKTRQSVIPYYLLSQAIVEYQKNPNKLITLESYPPSCIVVIDDASDLKTSTLQDRLLAWTGDYKMWRNELKTLYIVFTNEELTNSALASVLIKFNGRKATDKDSLSAAQSKIKNDNKNKKQKQKQKQKQQQQQQQENNNKRATTNDGWHTQANSNNSNNTNDNNNENSLVDNLKSINFSSRLH